MLSDGVVRAVEPGDDPVISAALDFENDGRPVLRIGDVFAPREARAVPRLRWKIAIAKIALGHLDQLSGSGVVAGHGGSLLRRGPASRTERQRPNLSTVRRVVRGEVKRRAGMYVFHRSRRCKTWIDVRHTVR